MRAQELRKMTKDELQAEKQKLLKEQFQLRMAVATQQNVQTHRLGQARKDIARINTILNETRGES